MAGMEERLGAKTDDLRSDIKEDVQKINGRIDAQDERINIQDGKIQTCHKEVHELQMQFKNLRSNLEAQQQSQTPTHSEELAKQAWLGGFPAMDKDAIEREAAKIVCGFAGFEKVQCKGVVSTGAVIYFSSSHEMQDFVSKVKLPQQLYAKQNRPPRSESEKAISSKVTEAWNSLNKAGVPNNRLRANPRKGTVWIIAESGIAGVAATVVDDAIKWGPAAPSDFPR